VFYATLLTCGIAVSSLLGRLFVMLIRHGRFGTLDGLLLVLSIVTVMMLAVFYYSSKVSKLNERVSFVDAIREWSGAEKALVVGCGSGSFLVEVASRLESQDVSPNHNASSSSSSPNEKPADRKSENPSTDGTIEVQQGQVYGVDHWQDENSQASSSASAANTPMQAYFNVLAEQVSDRAQLRGVARPGKLTDFADNTFDVVVSAYWLHNLKEVERQAAVKEMLRVLKTGGQLALIDIHHTRCLKALESCGVAKEQLTIARPVHQALLGWAMACRSVMYTKGSVKKAEKAEDKKEKEKKKDK